MNAFNLEPDEFYHSIKHYQNDGCAAQYMDDYEYNGRTLMVNNKTLLNFANCSYLGLEKHSLLIEGAIEATRKYGTQNSMSRSLLSNPLYLEIESTLTKIFTGFPIVYSSTTLAHYAAMPILMKEKCAIILDAYVHNSVRTASQVCKSNGAFVLVSRHNDMEHVRYLIKRLKKEGYQHIWYCADGIYSMHGDLCNVKELQKLLDEEENFYAYVDDAHGIGCIGKHGCGYVIGNYGLHEKMIVAGSLSKSIATSGGFLIVPDKMLSDYLKLTGHTFIFSAPMPPSSLGSIAASLKLHLTSEIVQYQKELVELISYFKNKCRELSLALAYEDMTPIQLIRIGDIETSLKVQKKLINEGFFATMAAYPAVSISDGGIRISITRNITKTDIDNLLESVKKILALQNIQIQEVNFNS